MLPGTTSSNALFFAPSLLPGPGAALLARPWEAWEARRRNRRGRNLGIDVCENTHAWQGLVSDEIVIRGGGITIVQWRTEGRRSWDSCLGNFSPTASTKPSCPLTVTLLHNTIDNAPSYVNFDMLAGEHIPRTIPILRTNV